MKTRSERIKDLARLNLRRRELERVLPGLQRALGAGLLQSTFTPPEDSIALLGEFVDSYDEMEQEPSLHVRCEWRSEENHAVVSHLQQFKAVCADGRAVLIYEGSDLGLIWVRFHSVLDSGISLASLAGNGFSIYEPLTKSGMTLFKDTHLYGPKWSEAYWVLLVWGSSWLNHAREIGGNSPGGVHRTMTPNPRHEEVAQRWYDHKSRLMCTSLGREHDTSMHAIIPYAAGGALDLYYYPNGIRGTAIATKELSEMPNEGPSNDRYRSYELVMFTKHALDLDSVPDETTDFGRAYKSIDAILNVIARYTAKATLNANETCEFPADMEGVGGRCLIFDGYSCHSDEWAHDFGILVIIEVFRSEMEFAREYGGEHLIARMRTQGCYPYSDLERDPVA